MVKQLQWWYAYRDTDRDGMCQYMHGNDSGWDNATCFDQGYPTEGADLAAHLILQAEGLARIARILGKPDDEKKWQRQSRKQLRDLLRLGVKDHRFFSPISSRQDAPVTRSLLNYIPVILGRRLPEKVRRALLADLSPGGPFLTEYGYATESPTSPKYESDGYWRGPIWAPPTYMIFDGLVDMGETPLARTVARRFCDMCTREPGMWENYDALTGKGLRCPGYSWTAAVFLLLAEWLKENDG
jgi:glycogen debranching enzyme